MHGCESWTIKKAECWRIDVLELQCFKKTLESLSDCKQIKLVNANGNQPFIGRTDAEAEAPMLWPPDAKSRLVGKDSDAGKGWRQEEKGMTENKMVGWHHWLSGHEFEQAQGDGEGWGSLLCCSPGGGRVTHDCVTEQQQQKAKMSHITWPWKYREFLKLPRQNLYLKPGLSTPTGWFIFALSEITPQGDSYRY